MAQGKEKKKKEESHLRGNWIFKRFKRGSVCYACSSQLLIVRFHNSQYICLAVAQSDCGVLKLTSNLFHAYV